jgi:hypothetical protein
MVKVAESIEDYDFYLECGGRKLRNQPEASIANSCPR